MKNPADGVKCFKSGICKAAKGNREKNEKKNEGKVQFNINASGYLRALVLAALNCVMVSVADEQARQEAIR